MLIYVSQMLIYVSQMLIYVSQMLIAPPFHHQRYSISPPTLKQSSKQVAMPTSAQISKKVTSVSPPFHPTLHDFTQK